MLPPLHRRRPGPEASGLTTRHYTKSLPAIPHASEAGTTGIMYSIDQSPGKGDGVLVLIPAPLPGRYHLCEQSGGFAHVVRFTTGYSFAETDLVACFTNADGADHQLCSRRYGQKLG